MGSDMSKPRKMKHNPGLYTQNQNCPTLIRQGPSNKHLICKEIDLPLHQQQQPLQEPCQEQYYTHPQPCRQMRPQQVPQPPQVYSQPPPHHQPQPIPEYVNSQRDNCYDQFVAPCRENCREVYTENFIPGHVNSYHVSRYNDGQVPNNQIDNGSRSDRSERPERYRTHRSATRQSEEEYIERYEIPKSSSRSYKPTYQYYDDIEGSAQIKSPPLRYRSKSSDKYLETKSDYNQYDEPSFSSDPPKAKLQSRSVYFIKDGQGETYECNEIGAQKDRYKYDSRANLSHRKSHTNLNSSSQDSYGYKPAADPILVKPNGTCKEKMPVVNVVSNNNDIVYVPMVKTEFIKRESQKVENVGQMSYHLQVKKHQDIQHKALKSDYKKLSNLTKSYISLHNIESTLKDELDTHRRNETSNATDIKQKAESRDSSPYKPILKKSPINDLMDSDTTSSSQAKDIKNTLREKLNAEFHQARQKRNYFNTVNYKTDIVYSSEILTDTNSAETNY